MQRGEVDMCIVGTDRTIATGDVANKIGTYLKALAAKDNNVPFLCSFTKLNNRLGNSWFKKYSNWRKKFKKNYLT